MSDDPQSGAADPGQEATSKGRGKVEVSKRLLLVNSTSSVAARILNISVLVWVQQYLLRRISPEEYSLLPVVTSLMILVPLISYALTSGFGRFVTAAYDEGRLDRVTSIVSTVLPVLATAALLLLVVGGLAAYHVDSIVNVPPDRLWDARIMLGLLVSSAALDLVVSPFVVGFDALQRFVLKNLLAVFSELFRMALLTALLLAEGPRVIWVVASETAASMTLILTLQHLSRRWLPALRFDRAAIDWPSQRELMTFSAWGFVVKTSSFVRTTLNPIILNRLATPLDVACFHLGTIVTKQLQTIGRGAAAASAPMLTALFVRGETEALKQAYLSGNRYSMWLSMAIASPLIALAPELFRLYAGESYVLAGTILTLSLMTFPPKYGTTMLPRLASATATQRAYGLALVALQIIDLALALMLTGSLRMGAYGVAIAGVISSWVVIPLLHVPIGAKLSGASLSEYFFQCIGRGMLPCLLALPALFALRWVIQPSTWGSLFLIAAAGSVVYAVGLLTVALGAEDRAMLRALTSAGWKKVRP
ncbi:MAG: hypothetical protein HYV07_29870 [Deltaproteobacteria bacterium]|nr:hypothetical protein [Deltaproteobacteria bacterium]